MHRRSLFWWIANRLLVVVLLASALLLLYLRHLVLEQRLHHQRETLQLQAVLASDIATQRLRALEGEPPDELLQALCVEMARQTEARCMVLDPQGRVVADSTALGGRRVVLAGRQDVAVALGGQVGVHYDRASNGYGTLHVAAPLPLAYPSVLRLSRPMRLGENVLSQILSSAILPALVLGLLVLLVALLVSRRIEYIMAQNADRLLRFGAGDFAIRSPATEFQQVSAFTDAFDEMAAKLETQVRELRLEKQQLIALFTGMREGIVAVDSDINTIAMNQAARLFLGLSDDTEMRGQPLFMAVRNAKLNHFVHALLRGKQRHLEQELEVRGEGGHITTFRLSGVRFTLEQGGEQGALVVMHDITRIRRLEEMRKEFVANVSHELKTPITAIKGFIETLESCLESSPEQARRFIGIIATQTDRLNAIINDLLTLSRLEQADHWVAKDFESRDLAVTVANAIRLCDAKIQKRQMRVEAALPAATVYANHRLLEQAVANLVDNAVKYSPEGATIRVSIEAEEQHIVLQVADNGPGIPREHLERIFERFHRVDKSRDRQTGGTGLGLSIVKHITRVHGGSVQVESTVGEGAVFILRLPKRQAASKG